MCFFGKAEGVLTSTKYCSLRQLCFLFQVS